MPKIIDAPHKIIQLNVLATGQLILTTENRVYAQKDGVWHAMEFAPDPVDPPPPEDAKAVQAPWTPSQEPKV